ncbi:MAG TPA: glycosyltransferase, partial [Marinilabiliaceae bacterium]|nr:glycosyltransferase [Marinilabiliaceae bacterium]
MSTSSGPLVSVIIPCYNHGEYLSEAIESVLNQTYTPIEVIVIDDGSSDNTEKVAKRYPSVKYFYQENKGLSSARNLGIANSTGELLVFLDADDLLLHYAIDYNVAILQKDDSLAFVSGAYQVTTLDHRKLGDKKEVVNTNHFINLLQSNYIGMHATVMYRRHIFDEFQFDTTLKACEDYDVYLKVARKHPVAHHSKMLTSYRMHKSNMSGNNGLMLKYGLEVLSRQEALLSNRDERKAYKLGLRNFKLFYTKQLYNQLRMDKGQAPQESLIALRDHNFILYARLITTKFLKKHALKRFVPESGRRLLFRFGLYKTYIPSFRSVKQGDFKRVTPFSTSFGYDRGGPIDRYYIEKFLDDEKESICGNVLEIGDNEYTMKYGTNVNKSEILHVDNTNPNATIIGDLSNAPQIPDNGFDCVILTQTLHLVYDYKAVINTCYRILRPGGCLLMTVPGITPIDYGEWGNTWLWSFTGLAVRKILSEEFSPEKIKVNTFGNVYAA